MSHDHVVARVQKQCPRGQLGPIDLACVSVAEWSKCSLNEIDGAIGPFGILQSTLAITSWSFRVTGPLDLARRFLACYRLQVCYMQRSMLIDVLASSFGDANAVKPWVLERGVPLSVRLIPLDEKALSAFFNAALNNPDDEFDKVEFIFEMYGRNLEVTRPHPDNSCSVCGQSAVCTRGVEPRCLDHVDTRISTLSRQVAEFHKAVGQPILDKPQVPSDDRIRLRLKLIAEEFFELLDACGLPLPVSKDCVMGAISAENFRNGENQSLVSLIDLADAMADLDYVVEGTRLEFGINGTPIADEVHRANMLKLTGPKSPEGKQLKPPGFQPPDVEGELRKQGWR